MEKKRFILTDANRNNLTIQHSSSIDPSYRIYIEFNKEAMQNTPNEQCIHLREDQAIILIHALKDLIQERNESI